MTDYTTGLTFAFYLQHTNGVVVESVYICGRTEEMQKEKKYYTYR